MKPILVVEILQKTEEAQPIYLDMSLKPMKAYILEVELKSFAPYDLLRFPDHNILDSYPDSWSRHLEWTRNEVVFVTPDWPDGVQEIRIELARIYDRGQIFFRVLDLVEVKSTEPVRGGQDAKNALAY